MGSQCRFWNSTVGKKVVMALTGAMMVLFVVGHMAGNLKIFGGIDASGLYHIDSYAHFLRTIGEGMLGQGGFLWLTRAGLLAAVLLHIWAAVSLKRLNAAARPVPYQVKASKSATLASRGMFYGGILLLVFIVVHILHFTTGHLHFDGFLDGRVYSNLYGAFSHWQWVLFYLAAMSALGLHLYHGTWSMLQTLGVDTPRWNKPLRTAAQVIAVLVFAGFVSVPLTIFFQVLPLPNSGVNHAAVAQGGAEISDAAESLKAASRQLAARN